MWINEHLGRIFSIRFTMIVNTYVDGFNLYHVLDRLGGQCIKWLDHWKLAAAHLKPEERLGQVYFFTAVVTWDMTKQ